MPLTVRARLVCLTLALAISGRAQTQESRTFAGIVTNSVTGEPVSRVAISVTCYGTQSFQKGVLTDATGAFRITGIPERGCGASARKPGFQFARINGLEDPKQPADRVKVALAPFAAIAGVVTDDRGEPWPNVVVEALAIEYPEGELRLRKTAFDHTDDRGVYRLHDLSPGQYLVRVSGRTGNTYPILGVRRFGDLPYESFAPLYASGALTQSAATPSALASGQKLSVNFTLKRQPGYVVRGYVSNLSQQRAARIQVLRDGEQVEPGYVALNPGTGEFSAFGVVDGAYTIRAVQGEKDAETRAEQVITLRGASVDKVLLEMESGLEVPFNVAWEGSPPEFVTRAGQIGRVVSLRRSDTFAARYGSDITATPDGPGAGKLIGVFPGRYRVSFGGFGYAASIRCGETDLLREDLIVTRAGVPRPIEIVVRYDAGQVTGKLRQGAGHVVLLPVAAGTRPIVIHTSADGKFQSPGVPPGEYQAYAWTGTDQFEYSNPEVLRSRARANPPFKVEPLGNIEITLDAAEVSQ